MKALLLFLLLYSISFSETIYVGDSINYKLELLKLNTKFEKLQKQNDSLIEFNNKLIEENYDDKNRIMQYEVKDDFFGSAFFEQTLRFTLIILFVSTILIIIVFYSYNFQTKRLNEKFGTQIISQKSAFSELHNRIENLEFNLNISLGNISSLLSEFHFKNANPFLGVKYCLIAARYIYLATQIQRKKDLENGNKWTLATISMLNLANDNLNKIDSQNQSYKDAFRFQLDDFMEQLNELTKSKNDNINDLSSTIKLKIKNISAL